MSWKDNFSKEHRYFETKNGILYNCDNIKLLPILPQNYFDLVLTDPPYGVKSNELNGIDYKDNYYDVYNISKQIYNLLKDNTRAFIFLAQNNYIKTLQFYIDNGFNLHQTLIWFRPNLAGGTKKKTYDFTSVYEQILNLHKGRPQKMKKTKEYHNFDVLKYAMPQSNYVKDKRYHIHQKPLELIKHLILVSSNEYDIILDPFSGSGTTLVAAEQLNRRWIGIEINEEYCEIAKNRLEEI